MTINCWNCRREAHKSPMGDDNGLCNLCEMLIAGAPPQIKTEATFQAKAGLGGSQFHPDAVANLSLAISAKRIADALEESNANAAPIPPLDRR